jgi:transposase
MDELYWLSDEAWAVIEPHLPHGRPGARRVDDRRVISGILHVLKSGCRWRDLPSAYGPRTTLYNRYNRWARQGIWKRVFEQVAGTAAVPDELAIDSTHIKAHRSASGAKRGKRRRRSVARAAGARARSTRWLTLSVGRLPSR